MNDTLRNMTSLYICRDDKILLLYRQGGRVVNHLWIGSAGGHMEEAELNCPRQTVLRELREEIGIAEQQLEGLQLRYITLKYINAEIRQNYYYFAQLRKDVDFPLRSEEGELRWFTYDELEHLSMPMTSQFVIAHYLRTGRFTNCLYGGVSNAEQVIFTEMDAEEV